MYSPPTNTEVSLETETRRKAFPLGALLLGVLLGWVLLSLFSHAAKDGVWNRLAGMMTGRSTRVDTSTPAVVEKIRQLSRLETVDYSIDKIVEGSRQNPYLPNFLVGDKLMLVAHGDVIAGVDLGQLQPADVAVDGSHVRVRLPQAQVLSTRIDNAHTRVYSRMTGVLVEADPNLESEVRLAAEDQFTQAALADGVLDKARQNAQASVSALLRGLGFQQVDVQ
jgi:Protein of unknown function (DUF4230)